MNGLPPEVFGVWTGRDKYVVGGKVGVCTALMAFHEGESNIYQMIEACGGKGKQVFSLGDAFVYEGVDVRCIGPGVGYLYDQSILTGDYSCNVFQRIGNKVKYSSTQLGAEPVCIIHGFVACDKDDGLMRNTRMKWQRKCRLCFEITFLFLFCSSPIGMDQELQHWRMSSVLMLICVQMIQRALECLWATFLTGQTVQALLISFVKKQQQTGLIFGVNLAPGFES